MLKNDEILIVGKIGPKISVALSKNYGKIKFIGSQSLLTLSVYKVNFYLNDSNELVKIKESKFLYSFYPVIKNYEKYKFVLNVFKIINEFLPSFFHAEGIYEFTLDYLKNLIDEHKEFSKLYMLWLYKFLNSLNEIEHLIYCKNCGSEFISFYKKGEGGFCKKCLKKGDFEIKNYELELIMNLYKFDFRSVKNLIIDTQKFIEIFEDSIYSL